MKKMIFILLTVCTWTSHAQNLFAVKLDNCTVGGFCLDCGDTKAGYDQAEFSRLQNKLNKELNVQGIKGAVKFQVLVDAKGQACVLSHTDQSNHPITLKIIEELNQFRRWTSAVTNGNKEERSSINVTFVISDNKISGQIERVDMDAFYKSFDKPRTPEIFNKTYHYKNENLKNYTITVWNSRNSDLPNNTADHITVDKNGIIWLTVDEGIVTFDSKGFHHAEPDVKTKRGSFSCYALATDNNNVKWFYAERNIYSFDNTKWRKYDSSEIGIDEAYEIVNNAKTGELFFCTDEGLTIYKEGKWTNLNKSIVEALPTSRVAFAKRDSKNRIWVGTYSGSAVIDEHNNVTNFETTTTVLKGKCITSMDEDEMGNLFFTLYEFDRKETGKVNNNEGIAIHGTDGSFKQFTTDNSGMPFNHANCVLYDRNEKVLWISTDRAGLVRYDLKNGWENYHNENSNIPTSYISTMTFDDKGNLYLATRQGLVKIERK